MTSYPRIKLFPLDTGTPGTSREDTARMPMHMGSPELNFMFTTYMVSTEPKICTLRIEAGVLSAYL